MYTMLIPYLKEVYKLSKISAEKTASDEVFARIANALRLYYLGLNQIFITKKILSNINFSNFSITEEEKIHLENAGWLLDEKYNNDVYISALKSNLILDIWSVLPIDFKNNKDLFFINFKKLVDACLNNGISNENITFTQPPINHISGIVNFMTFENTLKLIEELINKISKAKTN